MLNEILTKCKKGEVIADKDIEFLLTRENAEDLEQIYEAARKVRRQNFGDKVFLYGFVYFSTYCKNNCTFCYYRSNVNNLT